MGRIMTSVTVGSFTEPGHEIRIGKMERPHAARGWHGAVWTDRGDATVCINENGAILNRRCRDRMDETGTNSQRHKVQATRGKKSCADAKLQVVASEKTQEARKNFLASCT